MPAFGCLLQVDIRGAKFFLGWRQHFGAKIQLGTTYNKSSQRLSVIYKKYAVDRTYNSFPFPQLLSLK